MPANLELPIPDLGVAIGIGGTNIRRSFIQEGELFLPKSSPVPTQVESYVGEIASIIVAAKSFGAEYAVVGHPGPVSADGSTVGPLANVAGLKDSSYKINELLAEADPAVRELIKDGFPIHHVNDGTLAAHAVSEKLASPDHTSYTRPAVVIVGSGVESGIVQNHPDYANIRISDPKNPDEVGQVVCDEDTGETYEQRYSGTGIKTRRALRDPDLSKLSASDTIWQEEGRGIGNIISLLGLIRGVDLVVPTGGIGALGREKWAPHMERYLEDKINGSPRAGKPFNKTQIDALPAIQYVPLDGTIDPHFFELLGGIGVVRESLLKQHLARAAMSAPAVDFSAATLFG